SILKFAKNENLTTLSGEMRSHIMFAVITTIFRSPRFLKGELDLPSVQEDIPIEKVENERQKRILALGNHLKKAIELIKLKKHDGIAIVKAVKGMHFITCDNPVIVKSVKGEFKDYFDQYSMFLMPISPQYLITIAPNYINFPDDEVVRNIYEKKYVIDVNREICNAHETFLIGAENGIEYAEQDLVTYADGTSEGEKLKKDNARLIEIHRKINSYIESNLSNPEKVFQYLWKIRAEEELLIDNEVFENLMRRFVIG
ncbi:MAG: DUF4238 domain-containing protein, partial [Crocinitomicaceae bacterium]|nr:DUF4238 domain-containing protein [Crocinitomicaceae bacterium]